MNAILAVFLGTGVIGSVLGFILKKFITEELLETIGNVIRTFFHGLGVVSTLGLSKIPYLKGLWNLTIEPYVIILLDVVFLNMVHGFTDGLETDNKSLKND